MNTRKRSRKTSEEGCEKRPKSASKLAKSEKVTNTNANSGARSRSYLPTMENSESETNPDLIHDDDSSDFSYTPQSSQLSSLQTDQIDATDDILRRADVLMAEIAEYRQELNESQNNSAAAVDSQATIIISAENGATTQNNENIGTNHQSAAGTSSQATNTANNNNNNPDDSVVVIDDSITGVVPVPVRAQTSNKGDDEDVIFVTETRGSQRQRTVAMIDLCDSPDIDKSDKSDKFERPAQPGMTKCPICLEMFGFDEILSTMCGHLFCGPCITGVIKTRKKCPMCNRGLKQNQVHRIFLDS